MKKTNRIRLFLFVGVLVCCIAYGGGYYQSLQQKEENISSDETAQPTEIMESSNVVSAYQFVLGEEDGYVVVYYADAETVYATTDIKYEYLPERLQTEIQQGKQISTEKELYNFLENYSS